MQNTVKYLIFSIFLSLHANADAKNQTINLVVAPKIVNFAGRKVQTIAINDQIPAPILRFQEGDQVTINVHNHLDEGTTIHWHGLLVPWMMDGVEFVTQEPIAPGDSFSYRFTLRQSGTYWYHAHSGFQEQRGMYGGFIIDPKQPPAYHYTKDYVIVLSDWTNAHPNQVFANLKKDGDYYAPSFPLQPSLTKYLADYDKASPEKRQKLMADYDMMQQMRMNIYDLSDVAYDAYLLNGRTKQSPWTAAVDVGDTVRLRFIGAGGSTIYRVKIPGTMLKVVHIQGHDVEPHFVDDFTIAPGETTDILVTIEKDNPTIIYAESSDSLGVVYGALVTHPKQVVDYQKVPPFPEPQPVMMGHQGMSHGMSHEMKHSMTGHSAHSHHASASSEPSPTMGTKYQNLKSPVKTNDPQKSVQEIKMELSGYMGRFMWFINGLAELRRWRNMVSVNWLRGGYE